MAEVEAASTLQGLPDTTSSLALWGRRMVLFLLLLGVVVSLLGGLGVKTREIRADRGGYRLTLHYPATARAGLDVVWRVQVDHPGGFGKEITLAVTGDYFDIFETQGLWPEPSSSVRDGTTTYLTFDAPEGDRFVVDYDAYVQPASQIGRTARVALVSRGVELVGIDYTTWLAP